MGSNPIRATDRIGTAAALYPVVKKQNDAMALGFVASRVLEASAIFVGVAFLLLVVTLQHAAAGPGSLVIGQALVAMYDRIFLLGQSFMPAVNALLLGSLLYQSRLVPRALPLLGLIGAPLLIGGDVLHRDVGGGQHPRTSRMRAVAG